MEGHGLVLIFAAGGLASVVVDGGMVARWLLAVVGDDGIADGSGGGHGLWRHVVSRSATTVAWREQGQATVVPHADPHSSKPTARRSATTAALR